jgi:glycosyltransferase involved in cell wall biosynthesis
MIEKKKPLLSIIVPTKNRSQYAKSCIFNVLSIENQHLELIIQDNSDDDALGQWIAREISDKRLVYNFTEDKLSFVANFNKAVESSNGEYICIIGDDDGVNPEIIAAVNFLKANNIQCLSIRTISNYVWPNSGIPKTLLTKQTDGNLFVSKLKGYFYKSDIEKELNNFLLNGATCYLDYDLPKLYHGIVKRDCFNSIHFKTGSYFGGLSPDIFASIALACTIDELYITDYPLTIPGVSAVSASIVEGLLKSNSKKLYDAPHFKYRGDYTWSEIIPKIYTVETIWADSTISALSAMGRNDLIQNINISKLVSLCYYSNNDIYSELVASLKKGLTLQNKKTYQGLLSFYFYVFLLYLKGSLSLFKRIYNRVLIILNLNTSVVFYGIHNIYDASKKLSEYLILKKKSVLKVLNLKKMY